MTLVTTEKCSFWIIKISEDFYLFIEHISRSEQLFKNLLHLQ